MVGMLGSITFTFSAYPYTNMVLALVPILIPGSISVINRSRVLHQSGVVVPSLNFSTPLTTLQQVGNQDVFSLQMADTPGIGASYDRYLKASLPIASFISSTLYGKRIVDIPSPCGANCSFAQIFVGPAYKCDDVDYTKNDVAGNPFCINSDSQSNSGFGACGGTFDHVYINPFVTTWYEARNSSGNHCDDILGCTGTQDAWADGKLWVLYQYLLPQYRNENDQGTNSTPIPPEGWERHMFVCQSYNATYELQV